MCRSNEVVDRLKPQRSLSNNPLFNVLLVVQNLPIPALKIGDSLEVEPIELYSYAMSKFDLELGLTEVGDRISGTWDYSTDLFDADSIARLSSRFIALLEAVVARPDASVRELTSLPDRERG